MGSLDKLIEKQHQLEGLYRGFIYSLDGSRTATLRQFLLSPSKSLEKLKAGWINHERLLKRMGSMAEFFEGIQDHERVPGYDSLPLIFLQSTEKEEDEQQFEFIRQEWESIFPGSTGEDGQGDVVLRWKYEGFPAETPYLRTNFSPKFMGTWRSGKRIITPLFQFTSRGQMGMDRNGKTWRDKPMIIGFRVPNYPDLLSVNDSVATDYLARNLIHDMGHGFLPSITRKYESFHNVAMVYAMGVEPGECTSIDPWERLIHGESTNPFFFLEISSYLEGALNYRFSPLQQHIVQTLKSSESPEENPIPKKTLWGISENMGVEGAKERVVEVIGDMTKNGFAQYR